MLKMFANMSLETLITVTDYLFVAALVAGFAGIAFCANEIERELHRHKKRTPNPKRPK